MLVSGRVPFLKQLTKFAAEIQWHHKKGPRIVFLSHHFSGVNSLLVSGRVLLFFFQLAISCSTMGLSFFRLKKSKRLVSNFFQKPSSQQFEAYTPPKTCLWIPKTVGKGDSGFKYGRSWYLCHYVWGVLP